MIINKKSWHHCWLKFCFTKIRSEYEWVVFKPKSLCTYFWSFWFYSSLFLFLSVSTGGFILFCTVGIPVLFWSWLMNGSTGAVFGLLLILGFYIGIGLVFLYSYLKEFYDDLKYHSKDKSLGFAAITYQYAKTVKSKVCPLLEYEE